MLGINRPVGLFAIWLCCHAAAYAQTEPGNPSVMTEDTVGPKRLDTPTAIAAPSASTGSTDDQALPARISLEQLQAQPALTESLINQAIRQRQWSALAQLLPIYQQHAQHDPLLVLYAQGILYRQRAEHHNAIASYRRLLSHDPDLLYVRFDLAIMLYENKQYAASLDQFRRVLAGGLSPEFQTIAHEYIQRIQGQEKWQFYLSVQPERTNNINNASSVETIPVGQNSIQLKDYEPARSAWGLRYYAGADKTQNIQDNHYLQYGLTGYGIQYGHQNHAYNEASIKVQGGYLYQDVTRTASLRPWLEKTWFGGKPYQHSLGLAQQYSHWFRHNMQVNVQYNLSRKYYQPQVYKDYNATSHDLASGLHYFYSPTLILIGGVDMSLEKARTDAHSYRRYGLRLGLIKEFEHGLSTRLDWRYSYKKHKGKLWSDTSPDSVLGLFETLIGADVARRDHESRSTITLWHRNLHIAGFTPKLSYSHHRINSSIPLFYSRRSNNVYLNLEQQF